jgi:hypothetical protein
MYSRFHSRRVSVFSSSIGCFLFFAITGILPTAGQAQLFRKGDVVQNFTLTDRSTGGSVDLYSLEGKIIFLEWFAHWCPFCQVAASQIGPGVVNHFRDAGGNRDGLEFLHVALNLQAGQESQTQAFINRYDLGEVWNDFNGIVGRRFGSNQPIFAIINGVADSPSHQQWELILVQNGYGQTSFPIASFKNAINSVAAPIPDEPPAISVPPVTVSVMPGQPATFSVDATGDNLSYQWSKEGNPLAGATDATLEIPAVSSDDVGRYTVEVSNGSGSVASQSAFLVMGAVGSAVAELGNISTRLPVGTGSQILVAGFYVAGSNPGRVLVRGVGPTLAQFQLTGVLEDPILNLFRGNDEITSNDNWGSQMDPGIVQSYWLGAGAFDLADQSKDGALYEILDEGLYTAQVRGVADTTGIGLVEVYDVGDEDSGLLTNISTRGRIAGGADRMIMGFVLRGDAPRTVLVRAIGPTLSEFGLNDVVLEPELMLYRDLEVIAVNDRWADVQADEISAAFSTVGAFPLESDSADSAILIGLPPGRYTAHVSAGAGDEGIVLAEVYVLPES